MSFRFASLRLALEGRIYDANVLGDIIFALKEKSDRLSHNVN